MILDMQTKEGDPACTILLQHFSSLARIVRNWPAAHRTHLQQAWESTWNALSIKQYPWKTAAGPLGAAVAYLLSLKWQAPTLHSWSRLQIKKNPGHFPGEGHAFGVIRDENAAGARKKAAHRKIL